MMCVFLVPLGNQAVEGTDDAADGGHCDVGVDSGSVAVSAVGIFELDIRDGL